MFNCHDDFNLLYALYPTHIFYHDSSFFNFSKYRRNALLGMTVSIAYDAHKMVATSQKIGHDAVDLLNMLYFKKEAFMAWDDLSEGVIDENNMLK